MHVFIRLTHNLLAFNKIMRMRLLMTLEWFLRDPA